MLTGNDRQVMLMELSNKELKERWLIAEYFKDEPYLIDLVSEMGYRGISKEGA